MFVSSREFSLIHTTSLGTTERGVFEVGGGYFKFMQDVLVPLQTGANNLAFNAWDYAQQIILPPHAGSAAPLGIPLVLLTEMAILYSSRAPGPAIVGGGTITVSMCCGKVGDASTPTVMTAPGFTMAEIEPTYPSCVFTNTPAINWSTATFGNTSLTCTNITVSTSASVTTAGYLRVVAFGRFL